MQVLKFYHAKVKDIKQEAIEVKAIATRAGAIGDGEAASTLTPEEQASQNLVHVT